MQSKSFDSKTSEVRTFIRGIYQNKRRPIHQYEILKKRISTPERIYSYSRTLGKFEQEILDVKTFNTKALLLYNKY